MTIDNAIETLNDIRSFDSDRVFRCLVNHGVTTTQALDMAISALEAQKRDELVELRVWIDKAYPFSRQADYKLMNILDHIDEMIVERK